MRRGGFLRRIFFMGYSNFWLPTNYFPGFKNIKTFMLHNISANLITCINNNLFFP